MNEKCQHGVEKAVPRQIITGGMIKTCGCCDNRYGTDDITSIDRKYCYQCAEKESNGLQRR